MLLNYNIEGSEYNNIANRIDDVQNKILDV